MLEIVAGIGDDLRSLGRQRARKPERQLGAADAAGERNDEAL